MSDDIKWIDPLIFSIAVDYGIRKMDREYDEFYDKFPSVPEGTPGAIKVEREKTRELTKELAEYFRKAVTENYGEMPEVDPDDLYNPSNPPTDPDEPVEEMYGMKYKMVIPRNGSMQNDGTIQNKFDVPGAVGSHGEKLVFKWDDGLILYVPNSHEMRMNPPPDKRKYRPVDGGTAEVYAKVGTDPQSVTMYYSTASSVEPDPVPVPVPGGALDLEWIFNMTHQACSACGIWFIRATLTIDHTHGSKQYFQEGELLIKKAPRRVGKFTAKLDPIPTDAQITNATLLMYLHPHEGIASADNSGIIEVKDGAGRVVRTITAEHDIKGKGYNKPDAVPIDFTPYITTLYNTSGTTG